MDFILKDKLSFMTQPERRILPAVSLSGSGPMLCGNFTLPDGRKQASFDPHAHPKEACDDEKPPSTYPLQA
jgi:hypothetical protein